jgi:regulatory protein
MNEKKIWLQKLQKLCSKKEICSFDAFEKMKISNLSQDEKEEIIKILCQQGFIDNNRFVKAYIHDKLFLNKWGKLKIKHSLIQKKINEKIINDALLEIKDEEYLKIFMNLAKIKLKSIIEKDEFKKKQKLVQFLMQKGVEFEIANEIWNNLKK